MKARTLLPFVTILLATPASALPRVGRALPAAVVVDAEGTPVQTDRLRGRPVLIVYESRESNTQNQRLKDRLSKLAEGGRYRSRVHLLPIASVSQFDFWPARGFVEDAIEDESERIGTTIYCDWDGSFARALNLRPQHSSVILVSRQGRVVFAYEGALSRRAQNRLLELLQRETEPGPGRR